MSGKTLDKTAIRSGTSFDDVIPASNAIYQAARNSWWNWDDGSRPFYWRWPKHYERVIHNGLKVYFQQNQPPKYRKLLCNVLDMEIKAKVQ
jgi:hypothetical protein